MILGSVLNYTVTMSLTERKEIFSYLTIVSFTYTISTTQFSVSPYFIIIYLLEHLQIICTYSLIIEKNSNEPQNIIIYNIY